MLSFCTVHINIYESVSQPPVEVIIKPIEREWMWAVSCKFHLFYYHCLFNESLNGRVWRCVLMRTLSHGTYTVGSHGPETSGPSGNSGAWVKMRLFVKGRDVAIITLFGMRKWEMTVFTKWGWWLFGTGRDFQCENIKCSHLCTHKILHNVPSFLSFINCETLSNFSLFLPVFYVSCLDTLINWHSYIEQHIYWAFL